MFQWMAAKTTYVRTALSVHQEEAQTTCAFVLMVLMDLYVVSNRQKEIVIVDLG